MWMVILLLACGQDPEPVELPAPVQRAMTQDLGPELGEGRKAFRDHCQACHGMDALGDGPAAAALADTPGALAIRSRDPAKLERTIRRGIPGTAMQGFGGLEDAQIEAMAAWLAGLAPPPAAPAPE